METYFSEKDISVLIEAIRYFRSREGNFYSTDPLVYVVGKLKEDETRVRTKNFNKTELSLLLKVIDENIRFLNGYKYTALPIKTASNLKQSRLTPLVELRKKIITLL